MTLSVLIVNWNSKDYLRRCLQSIRGTCADLAPQIIVVDGGSYDGCGQMLATEFPEVTFIQSAENLGFGRSNNLGFGQVTGDSLLFLNPDTELKAGAISELLAELERLPDAGALGAHLLDRHGHLQTNCVQSFPTPLNQALDSDLLRRLFPKSRMWGTAGVYASQSPVEVEAICGACLLMRSEVFRKVGGFSPEYFMYGEDMDLCAKVRRSGLKVYHVPRAEVLHHGGASSTGSFEASSSIIMRESVFRFIRKHQGRLAAFRYRFLMTISSIVRIILLTPGSILRKKSWKTSMQKWIGILCWSVGAARRSRDPLRQPGHPPTAICAASPVK